MCLRCPNLAGSSGLCREGFSPKRITMKDPWIRFPIIPRAYYEYVRGHAAWPEVLKKLGYTAYQPQGGGQPKMRCTWHTERTASLKFQSNGYYRCFGCHHQGDIFQFVTLHHYTDRDTHSESWQVLTDDEVFSRYWKYLQRRLKTIRFFTHHFGIPSPLKHPEFYRIKRPSQ